jgi:hypothetical protein
MTVGRWKKNMRSATRDRLGWQRASGDATPSVAPAQASLPDASAKELEREPVRIRTARAPLQKEGLSKLHKGPPMELVPRSFANVVRQRRVNAHANTMVSTRTRKIKFGSRQPRSFKSASQSQWSSGILGGPWSQSPWHFNTLEKFRR